MRIELTAKGCQVCNVRVYRVTSGMGYEGFTTRDERHERKRARTSDISDISDVSNCGYISGN